MPSTPTLRTPPCRPRRGAGARFGAGLAAVLVVAAALAISAAQGARGLGPLAQAQAPLQAPSQAPSVAEPLVQLGGTISTLALAEGDDGQRLFAAVGSRIDVYDVDDAAEPRFLASSAPMPAQVQEMRIDGDLLIAAVFRGGIHTFDIAGPGPPELVGRLPGVTGSVAALRLQRGKAFVADRSEGLLIVDLEDPGAPRLVDRLDFDASSGSGPLQLREMAQQGELLALVGGDRDDSSRFEILVLDAADPAEPRELGRLAFVSSNPRGLVWRDAHLYMGSGYGLHVIALPEPSRPEEPRLVDRPEGMRVSRVRGSEDRLYQWGSRQGAPALLEYGLSDPAEPQLVAVHENEPWGAVLPHGGRVYNHTTVGGSPIGIYERSEDGLHRRASIDLTGYVGNAVASPERIWFTSHLGLHALDADTAGAPSLRWQSDWQAMRMALESERLYFAAGEDGLRSLDLSDPSSPRELEPVPLTDSSVELRNLTVAGERGFAIAWRGRSSLGTELWLLDLRPETGPERVGTLDVDLGWNAMPQMAVVGDWLLIGSDSASSRREIIAINVADLTAPREVLRVPLEDHVWALLADGDRRFYAGTDRAIVGYEIAGSPVEIVERSRWSAGEGEEARSVLGLALAEKELVAVVSREADGFGTPPIDGLGHAAALLRLQLLPDGRLLPLAERPVPAGLGWNVDYRPVVAGRWMGVPGANLGLNLVPLGARPEPPPVWLPWLGSDD